MLEVTCFAPPGVGLEYSSCLRHQVFRRALSDVKYFHALSDVKYSRALSDVKYSGALSDVKYFRALSGVKLPSEKL